MLLSDYSRAYAAGRDIAPATASWYVYAVRALERDTGHAWAVADLQDAAVNAWLAAQVKAGRNRKTLHTTRGAILTLWRAAHADGLADPPRQVRPVKVVAPLTRAWTRDEVARLLAAAAAVPGRFRRLKMLRGPLLHALFATAYYGALRPGDLLARRGDELQPNGLLRWRQNKTGVEHRVVLPASVVDLIRATFPPARGVLFPISRKVLAYYWPRLKLAAGVAGSPKWFRRAAATAVEALEPGAAWQLLGHTGPHLAGKSYIDWSQVPVRHPQPPPLVG